MRLKFVVFGLIFSSAFAGQGFRDFVKNELAPGEVLTPREKAWEKVTDAALAVKSRLGAQVVKLIDEERALKFTKGLEEWVPGGASTVFLARGAQVLGQDSCSKGFEVCGSIAFVLSFVVVSYQTINAVRFAIDDISVTSIDGPANREKVWKLIVPTFANICATMLWLEIACSKNLWHWDIASIFVLLLLTDLLYIRLAYRWMWPN